MKRLLALILSLALIGDTLPSAAQASPVLPAFPYPSQALAVAASSMRMPFRMPRYFYSMAAGAIAYTRTGSIAWLSVASSATLGLQLAKTLWNHRVDRAQRVRYYRNHKSLRRTLGVMLAGQLLMTVPWALPLLADQILIASSREMGVVFVLLGLSMWAGRILGDYLERRWKVMREASWAWGLGFMGSGLLMWFMGWPVRGWIWYGCMAALGLTMSMGFMFTKSKVRKESGDSRNYAETLYDIFVDGGAAVGVLLFGYLATAMGPLYAMRLNGALLVLFEFVCIRPASRQYLMGKMGPTFSLLLGVYIGVVYGSVIGILAGIFSATVGYPIFWFAKRAIMWVGHHERHRHPDNTVLGEPAAHMPDGVSKPDYDGSEPSRIWMPEDDGLGQREFDTLIVSDLHLRDPHMQAKLHLDLLRSHRVKRIYLLGDIFDEVLPYRMAPLQKEIVRHWARMQEEGVEIIYVPGNHDMKWREAARKGVRVSIHDEQRNLLITLRAVEEYAWTLPDGRRARAVHGDKYDALKSWNLWRLLEWIAGRIYDHMLDFDNWLLRERKYFTVSSVFSVAELAKRYVGYLRRMRNKMAQLEKEEVLFHGHTHDLEMRRIMGKLVIDTGNSQNTSYSNAVGIRVNGSIEAITWKRILWKGPIPAPHTLPFERIVLAGA